MADYKVGNLQIVFDTLNQTDEGFKKLASNLRAVQKAIAKIGDTDLKPFVANIQEITKSFTPLLTNISGASEGIIALNQSIQKVGAENLSKVAEELANIRQIPQDTATAIDEQNKTIVEGNEDLQQTKNIVKDIWSTFSNDTIQSTLDLQKQEQQVLRNKIAFLELAIADEKLRTAEDGTKFSTQELKVELKKLKKELGNTQKDTKKSTSGFSKLFASIKRIALYRLIRSALKNIASSITETAKAFAQVDDGVNKTMSKLTSSLSVIKLSFGATLLPLLTAIEPIITQIGIAFANVANMVSQAMSTTGTYTKINTDYIKNYRKELEKTGGLLDFDKIRSLTKKSGSLGDFLIPDQEVDEEYLKIRNTIDSLKNTITNIGSILSDIGGGALQVIADILKEISPVLEKITGFVADIINYIDDLGLIEPILWGIVSALTAIGAVKIFTWLAGNKIILWISAVIDLLKTDFRGTLKMLGEDFVKVLTSTKALVAGIGALAGSILYLASNWSQLNDTQKLWIPLASTLAGLVVGVGTALVLSITAIKEALKLNPAAIAKAAITAALFTAAAGIAIGTAISTSKNAANAEVAKMANGGIPSVGTLFYAGEAGAETVTVGSSGRTEVTNVSQMEQALYNALVRYGNQNRGTGDSGAININIDGQKVFEATRRTANKRGLDFSRI